MMKQNCSDMNQVPLLKSNACFSIYWKTGEDFLEDIFMYICMEHIPESTENVEFSAERLSENTKTIKLTLLGYHFPLIARLSVSQIRS